MKEDKEYTSGDELLHFVLTECADMKYFFNGKQLAISKNFNSKYIVYADQLLREHFHGESFTSLFIDGMGLEDNDVKGDWLSKLDLYRFDCTNNKIKNLPALPKNLNVIYCDENELSSLPDLPKTLNTLVCSQNKLESLPKLPNGLITLICEENDLKELPKLPNSLEEMLCDRSVKECTEYKIWMRNLRKNTRGIHD